jgi:hypothetical protein
MAKFDHCASAMGQRNVHLLVAVGHGGQWRQGFWLLAAWKETAPSTVASIAITSTCYHDRDEGGRWALLLSDAAMWPSEESSPKVDKRIFFQLGISTISKFLQPKKIFDHQEGISD